MTKIILAFRNVANAPSNFHLKKWNIGICDGIIYITFFLKLRFVYLLFSVVISADDIGSGNLTDHQCFC